MAGAKTNMMDCQVEAFEKGLHEIIVIHPFIRGSSKIFEPIVLENKAWERIWRRRFINGN